jgi:hypothetical protein
MLEVVVQPPTVARLGGTLEPPFVLKLRLDSGDIGQIWAHASLVNESGNAIAGALKGSLAASAQPMDGRSSLVGYFLFDNLVIDNVGRFRIRVTLMRMDPPGSGGNCATTVQQADSRLIDVQNGRVQRCQPSKAFLILFLAFFGTNFL